MRGMTAQTPSVYHKAVTMRKGMMSFIRPGWLGQETLQGPNLLQIFTSPEGQWTVEERAKWEEDLPTLIQEF